MIQVVAKETVIQVVVTARVMAQILLGRPNSCHPQQARGKIEKQRSKSIT